MRNVKILSSLIAICVVNVCMASDCIDGACDIEPVTPVVKNISAAPRKVTVKTGQTAPVVAAYAEPTEYIYDTHVPMRSVKLLSVKPVPYDTRRPLWDGTLGEYKSRGFDKTVDARSGVPIWDDSISHYKDKDFSDWFLEPMPEIYADDANPIDLYNQNMADAAATRARVEELLTPHRPTSNLWTEDVVTSFAPRPQSIAYDASCMTDVSISVDDGCPFETDAECEIWRRKPIIREVVSPRSPKIRDANMDAFLAAVQYNPHIDAEHPSAAPLLARYKTLMRAARSCCTDGMIYNLRNAGASDGLIYKFLVDDANFYGIGGRCLMMTDAELDSNYPNTATAAVAADVRNGCLCRGKQWFSGMLSPFKQAYDLMPSFANEKFFYTYTDGLGRTVKVSVNNDVQNVLNQLEQCP